MASTKADASKISLPDFTANAEFWPVLPPLEAWQDTRDTVHMWTQIVGKVRLALNPLINHWWEVPLYVSPRGLATSSIPYARGIFEVEFDFLADRVLIQTSEGAGKSLSLRPRSVADFYKEFMGRWRLWESPSKSGRCRQRCPIRLPSIAISSMRPMIAMLSFGSGEYWLQWIRFFKSFVHASLAKTVQSTFFGVALIWRLLGSQGDAHPSVTEQIPLPAKPTPTK